MDHIDKRAIWNIEGTYDWKSELQKFSTQYSDIINELHKSELEVILSGEKGMIVRFKEGEELHDVHTYIWKGLQCLKNK